MAFIVPCASGNLDSWCGYKAQRWVMRSTYKSLTPSFCWVGFNIREIIEPSFLRPTVFTSNKRNSPLGVSAIRSIGPCSIKGA
jgi:hypothetical protein